MTPATGTPMKLPKPKNMDVMPKALVKFSSPNRSTTTIERSTVKLAKKR